MLGSTKKQGRRGWDEKPGLNCCCMWVQMEEHTPGGLLTEVLCEELNTAGEISIWNDACLHEEMHVYNQDINAVAVSLGVRRSITHRSATVPSSSSCFSLGLSRSQHERALLAARECWFSLCGADTAVVKIMGSFESQSALGLQHLAHDFTGQGNREACWPGCFLLTSF